MLKPFRTAAHWVGRHAFPALAAAVIAVGAAGGGIGYAVASQHSATAPATSSTGSTITAPSPTAKAKGKSSRGTQVIQRALAFLASQTGQSVASVRSQLAAGKSINDIAGVKAPAIESQVLAQITKIVAKGVSAGKISATQQTADLATAKTKVDALMAEPGTQLLSDAQKFLQFLQTHGAGHHAAAATPAPSPAA